MTTMLHWQRLLIAGCALFVLGVVLTRTSTLAPQIAGLVLIVTVAGVTGFSMRVRNAGSTSQR